ncbi:MAG: hypothetical protein AAFV95_09840 [Bacteroidota bacterium]
MSKDVLLFTALLCFGVSAWSQGGCTDPLAQNYNASARTNDGSCTYASTSYQLFDKVDCADILEEVSGLAYVDGQLWGLNDSGNENEIYRIDPASGQVLQSVRLSGRTNVDWEDMAADDNYLYVGDFGNNAGNRRDLEIHRISISDLQDENRTQVASQRIAFSFSDQQDFRERANNHNFDCESFFSDGDSLHLFSKNWVDRQCRHYVLPARPGTYIAQVQESFAANGLITAVDRSEEGVICLLGYEGLTNFMWLLFDHPPGRPFAGNKRRIELGNFGINGQTEALVFQGQGQGWIGAEAINLLGNSLPPQLFSFQSLQWTELSTNADAPLALAQAYQLDVRPNPVLDRLWVYRSDHQRNFPSRLLLYNLAGQLQAESFLSSDEQREFIDLSGLPSGCYLLCQQIGPYQNCRKIIKQ